MSISDKRVKFPRGLSDYATTSCMILNDAIYQIQNIGINDFCHNAYETELFRFKRKDKPVTIYFHAQEDLDLIRLLLYNDRHISQEIKLELYVDQSIKAI